MTIDLDAIDTELNAESQCSGCGESVTEHGEDQKQARAMGWETHPFSAIPAVKRETVRELIDELRRYREAWNYLRLLSTAFSGRLDVDAIADKYGIGLPTEPRDTNDTQHP